MWRNGDLYSTFVVWVKVTLPLMALALLSTLFLFSGKVDVTKSLPYATLNVDELVREQRISRPYFDGISNSGTEITVTAAFAKPDTLNQRKFTAQDLQIKLRTPQKRALRMTAQTGVIDPKSALLSGGVTILTSDGMTIKTSDLQVDLDTSEATAEAGITAESEIGSLSADTMVLTQGVDGSEIVFKGTVRLLYQPNVIQGE